MLKLSIHSKPHWVDVGQGVSLLVSPITTDIIRRACAQKSIATYNDDGGFEFGLEIAQQVISKWKGVGDEKGKAVEVSKEWIERLFKQNFGIFSQFEVKVLSPMFDVLSEKKA